MAVFSGQVGVDAAADGAGAQTQEGAAGPQGATEVFGALAFDDDVRCNGQGGCGAAQEQGAADAALARSQHGSDAAAQGRDVAPANDWAVMAAQELLPERFEVLRRSGGRIVVHERMVSGPQTGHQRAANAGIRPAQRAKRATG